MFNRIRIARVFSSLVSIVFIINCAGVQVKSWSSMSDDEKVAHAMKAYTDAAEEYKYQFTFLGPEYTDEEVKFLNAYLDTLRSSWASIGIIDQYVTAGNQLTPSMETELLHITRWLTSYIANGGK